MSPTVRRSVALGLAVTLALAGCGHPRRTSDLGSAPSTGTPYRATDPNATGPAPEVPGARKGGTVTVYAQTMPRTFDPTGIDEVDAEEIGKLLFRTPTQLTMRSGRPVLVPDLTDLGTVSADRLTWTFKLRTSARYADGTAVTVADLAYAIKRSFAHDAFPDGLTYQLSYFAGGDTYKGPYTGGDTFPGVRTPDGNTLVIHLRKPFPDLPFLLSLPLFTPVPQARDTRQLYGNRPLATGPYQFDTFTPGAQLTLKRNPYWDASSDPARHQYPDAWDFTWGGDRVKNQQRVLDGAGRDAAALDYDAVDASLIPQLTGDRAGQLVKGDGPCTTVLNLDSRKIPLAVRKAIARAYPADQLYKAEGRNEYTAQRASTIMPPSVPGWQAYRPLPDLTGTGDGDPVGARDILRAAGKMGFQLSWYYDNTGPVPQQLNEIESNAFRAAGFSVAPIGVSAAEYLAKTSDYGAPVNIGQSPGVWCADWPTGSGWFPALFQSHSVTDGDSWGMLRDHALDAQIDQTLTLPADQRPAKWMALDQQIMSRYVVVPRFHTKLAVVVGTRIGGGEGDSTLAMPLLPNVYVKG